LRGTAVNAMARPARSTLLRWIRLCLLAAALGAGSVRAADGLITLPTRPGVTQSYWYMPRAGASATLLLLPGGAGGIGLRDGQPQSGNFLVRSRELFAGHGFHVAVLGRPSDVSDMDMAFRASAAHMEDLRGVIDDLRTRSGAPVWLVGTSRGTVSAAAGAIALGPERVAGVVLTSSVTSYRHKGVPTLALASIRVPVLVLHHEKDACAACAPHEVRFIADGLTQAPVKKVVWARDGSDPRGDPCEPFHWHGFIGMEAQAVQSIVSWVRQPAP
jgi:pimeloyl-ACP methyl ester carboxylesterase